MSARDQTHFLLITKENKNTDHINICTHAYAHTHTHTMLFKGAVRDSNDIYVFVKFSKLLFAVFWLSWYSQYWLYNMS